MSVYFRDGAVIAVPQGGGGGYSFDVEPVLVVEPEPEAVRDALAEALTASAAAQGHEPPEQGKSYRSPALKKLGVRSYRAFYRGASHCYLYEDGDDLVMLGFRPARDGRGFDMAEGEPVIISERADAGRVVVDYLREAPAMT